MPRRHVIGMGVALALAVVATVHAAPAKDAARPAKVEVSRDGWPATHEGEAGRAYVKAFNAGDAAMADFYRRFFHPDSLAKRSPEQRLSRYRTLREQFGSLAFASIVKASPGELSVRLLDADAAPREFVFTLETRSPFRLRSVGMRQRTGHGHRGFHH